MKVRIASMILASALLSGCGIAEAASVVSIGNTLLNLKRNSDMARAQAQPQTRAMYDDEQRFVRVDPYAISQAKLFEYGSLELMSYDGLN